MQVLTIAVLSIILTAPIGAVAISILGPILLLKESSEEQTSNDNMHNLNSDEYPDGKCCLSNMYVAVNVLSTAQFPKSLFSTNN